MLHLYYKFKGRSIEISVISNDILVTVFLVLIMKWNFMFLISANTLQSLFGTLSSIVPFFLSVSKLIWSIDVTYIHIIKLYYFGSSRA